MSDEARPMTTRTLLAVPRSVRRGEVFEVRATIGHPMETGYRPGADGRRLPRHIITRFTARFEGEAVLTLDLHPAISANPYLAFPMQVPRSGTLELRWEGDHGFAHVERVAITAT